MGVGWGSPNIDRGDFSNEKSKLRKALRNAEQECDVLRNDRLVTRQAIRLALKILESYLEFDEI